MEKMRARKAAPGAIQCLALLEDLRQRHRGFIGNDKDFAKNLDELEGCLIAGELLRCRASLGELLLRLEQIAEDQQRFYDESPAIPKKEDVPESTRDFEIKNDFEKMMALLS